MKVGDKRREVVRINEQGDGRNWCFAFCTRAEGALLPDGKLESELSLGHAEPFGSHPNGQFHRVGGEEWRGGNKLENKAKVKQRKRRKLDLKTISHAALHQLGCLRYPLLRRMG